MTDQRDSKKDSKSGDAPTAKGRPPAPSLELSPAGEDELQEAGFFIEQGLYDEATEVLDTLTNAFGEDQEIMGRVRELRARLAAATSSDEKSEEEGEAKPAAEEKEKEEEEEAKPAAGNEEEGARREAKQKAKKKAEPAAKEEKEEEEEAKPAAEKEEEEEAKPAAEKEEEEAKPTTAIKRRAGDSKDVALFASLSATLQKSGPAEQAEAGAKPEEKAGAGTAKPEEKAAGPKGVRLTPPPTGKKKGLADDSPLARRLATLQARTSQRPLLSARKDQASKAEKADQGETAQPLPPLPADDVKVPTGLNLPRGTIGSFEDVEPTMPPYPMQGEGEDVVRKGVSVRVPAADSEQELDGSEEEPTMQRTPTPSDQPGGQPIGLTGDPAAMSATTEPVLGPPPLPPPVDSGDAFGAASAEALPLDDFTGRPEVTAEIAFPRERRKLPLYLGIGLGGVVLVVIIVLVASSGGSDKKGSKKPSAMAAHVVDKDDGTSSGMGKSLPMDVMAAPRDAGVSPMAAVDAAVVKARLRLSIQCEGARPVVLFRGKESPGRTFDSGLVKAGEGEEKVVIKAKGYKEKTLMVTLDREINRQVALERVTDMGQEPSMKRRRRRRRKRPMSMLFGLD